MSRFPLAAGACITLAASTFPCVTLARFKQPLKLGTQVARVVNNLSHADTWGHPDQFDESIGVQLFADGRYTKAMKYFKISARYADKASQLAIGLMYTNGRGVKKSPVMGCAWLTLASQRKFPTFIATRNRVCNSLSSVQHKKADDVLSTLLPVYGDKIAKRRMTFALNQARMDETGSKLGFDAGIDICANLSLPTGSASLSGCSNGESFWSSWRWDPNRYFAARDAYWMSKVTVGALMGNNKVQPSSMKPMTTTARGH